jgi:hypothetical protein
MRKQSKQQEQQKKHKWSSFKSLSNWVDFGLWRELNALIMSLEYWICSCIECEVQKTWMAWMEVVGGIYSPNHYSSCCCRWHTGHDIVHCPVPTTSADRWVLERLIVEVLCPLVAPDSPVAYWACPVRSDFTALTSDFYTVRFLLFTQPTVRAVDRCSVGSPDMSSAHRTVWLIIAERLPEKPKSGQFVECSAWAPDSVWCATGSTIASLCSKLGWAPNLISFLVYVEPYAPKINDN